MSALHSRLPLALRRSFRAWMPPVMLATALVVLVLRIAARHRVMQQFVASASWGILVVLSFAGFGTAIAALAFPARRVDFGLRTGWGMAATVFIGGVLSSVGLARRSALVVLTAVGVALLGLALPRTFRGATRRMRLSLRRLSASPGAVVVALVLSGIVSLQYAASIFDEKFQSPDDLAAYFGFIKKLLATGSLIEPFSARRLASYGGQTLLQAQVLVAAPLRHVHLFDRGVSLLVLVAALVGHFSFHRRLPKLLVPVVVLFFTLLPDVRLNTGSLLSGAALFVVLFRTMDFADYTPDTPIRNGAVVGLCAAAACTLRQNYLPAAVLFVAIGYSHYLVRTRTRLAWREGLAAVGATTIALLPWAILTFRSNRTPLFPLIKGYADPAFDPFKIRGGILTLRAVVANATYGLPFLLLPLIFVVAAFLYERTPRRAASAMTVASLVTWLMVIRALGALQPPDIARYCAAFMSATVFAVLVTAAALAVRRDVPIGQRFAPLGVLSFIVLLQLLRAVDTNAGATWLAALSKLETYVVQRKPETPQFETTADSPYVALQASIPAGAHVLVAVEEPYRFDFRRNVIVNVDEPGAVSPPPGLHHLKSGIEVIHYLRNLGFTHLAYVKPARASLFYSEAHLRTLQKSEEQAWREFAEYFLQFQERLAEMQALCPQLHDDGALVSLDLTRCRES